MYAAANHTLCKNFGPLQATKFEQDFILLAFFSLKNPKSNVCPAIRAREKIGIELSFALEGFPAKKNDDKNDEHNDHDDHKDGQVTLLAKACDLKIQSFLRNSSKKQPI